MSDEWYGCLPSRWDARRIKMVSPVMRGASPRPIDDPVYFDESGEYAWVRISDVTASQGHLHTTTQRLSDLGASKSVKLDIGELFLSIAGSVGKPCVTGIKACIHDGFVYFPCLPKESQRYLYWIFESGECFKGLGKLGTQLNLNTETVGNISIPFPDFATQQTIAEFLNRETARIEQLIEKKQRFVELLEERQQAALEITVRGLMHSGIQTRNSGAEWIGDIPAYWSAPKINQVARLATGHTPSRSEDSYWIPEECTIPWFTLADVWQIRREGRVYVSETKEKISPRGLAHSSAELLPANTVILSRTASVGFPGIMAVPMATTQDFVNWFCGPTLRPKYLYYVLRAMRRELKRLMIGSTHQTIYMPDVRAFTTPLPPLAEQDAIVDELDSSLRSVNSLTSTIAASVDRLRELRSALITAAVTGQIDVATWGRRGTTDRRLEAIEEALGADTDREREEAAV